MKLKNVINKHKSNKIKENSNTVRHLNNGTDHRHSKSCCDQSSPARRTIICENMKANQANISPKVTCGQEPTSLGGNDYLHQITGIQGSCVNAIIHLVHS